MLRYVVLACFAAKVSVSLASPSWTLFDDDTGKKTEFALDQKKDCTDEKKANSLNLGEKTHFVPPEIRDLFIPLMATSTDSVRYEESNRAFCRFALQLATSGCNYDDLKIVTRLQSHKLGYVNEGAKGKKYITEFMVYGCDNKLGNKKTPANCVYPKEKDEDLMEPMGITAYAAFTGRCTRALRFIGGPHEGKVVVEDSSTPLTHITRDPTVAIR